MAETKVPDNLRYTEEHEYVMETDSKGEVIVGITDFAQNELSDIVFVELPDVGASFSRMESFGTIEAVKAVSDLYIPLSGKVIGVNDSLEEEPSLINTDPYGDGWMVRLSINDPSELNQLLGPDEYTSLIAED
ncbi:MAG: glycine cleavage system protein GcvH [Gemmatimonadota bacterium]|jgi:glycine cleavage system H protein